MCWMPASGYFRLAGIVVGSRCTGRMWPLRSLVSITSLATLWDATDDGVTTSRRTLAFSMALTIDSPQSAAPSMPPWSIQTLTPDSRSLAARSSTRALSSRE